jgi:hypothetical protein
MRKTKDDTTLKKCMDKGQIKIGMKQSSNKAKKATEPARVPVHTYSKNTKLKN